MKNGLFSFLTTIAVKQNVIQGKKLYKHEINLRLSCGSPRLVALGIFGALTKLKSAANDLPYTSQVALGLFGQCNAQASKVAHSYQPPICHQFFSLCP